MQRTITTSGQENAGTRLIGRSASQLQRQPAWLADYYAIRNSADGLIDVDNAGAEDDTRHRSGCGDV